jgi:hypothetical protein
MGGSGWGSAKPGAFIPLNSYSTLYTNSPNMTASKLGAYVAKISVAGSVYNSRAAFDPFVALISVSYFWMPRLV